MATLQQQRQAIAQGVANSRQATGAAERQAIGQGMIEERTGKQVAEDINRLVTPARQRRSLPAVPAVGAVPASKGRGEYKPPPATTGGIASPLEEKTTTVGGELVADGREYHPARVLETTDGIFSLVLKPIKRVLMIDANGVEHPFGYAMPAEGE